MANHLKRHVVSIPLARIQTNEELQELVYNRTFHVTGVNYPLSLR